MPLLWRCSLQNQTEGYLVPPRTGDHKPISGGFGRSFADAGTDQSLTRGDTEARDPRGPGCLEAARRLLPGAGHKQHAPRASGIENAQNKRDDDHTPTACHPPRKGTDSHSADQIRPVKVSTCIRQHLVETPRHHMKNGFCWRRVPESNRSSRICNPLRNLSANPPQPVFLYGSRRAWSRVYHCVHHVPALCLIWRRAALPGLRCAM